jgi:hypothetical protein
VSEFMTKLNWNALARWMPIWQAIALGLIMQLLGCGGSGGNGGSPGPPPSPDFSLATNPTSQSVDAGSSASISLSATAIDGFSSQISVQVTGLPSGVTVSPTSITLVVGTPQQVTFTAAANAPNANATVTFTGTSGALTHTAGLSLTVNGTSNGPPVRTRYVRTDATTEYYQWINQNWILYHAKTARYFVSDPTSNQVIVLDGASKTKIAALNVPGAFGMDDTADHSVIYVGTLIGDVYTIDPVALAVTRRYIASEIGPYGYSALSALGLADGRVALQGRIPGVFESDGIAVWNPTDNSITIYGSDDAGRAVPLPCGDLGTIGGFTLTVDRTKIILGGVVYSGSNTLCEVDPATGQGNNTTTPGTVFLSHILTSPDGKYIIQPGNYPTAAIVYDANTLGVVAQFAVLGDTSSASGFFISADSKTLYTPADAYTFIYAYDLATQQLVGWMSNIDVLPTSAGEAYGPIDNPYLLATDGTGLFAGPMEEGVGFVDLSALQTGGVGTQFTNGYLDPATGPSSGGTATKWSDPSGGTLESIYFGSRQATNISESSNTIHATSPPGHAGPADVYTFANDGGMQVLPEAFSYGPTIVEVTPNMSTAEGGGTGYIYGYGFGPIGSNGIPPDLKVTVAGVTAQATAFAWNAYSLASPPFPLQSVAYTIPPGVSGTTVNVAVTTSSGSATATGALEYLPAIQQFPLAGSTLVQGIYDPHADVYYFTDATQVEVFSRTQGNWLSPIPIAGSQRLWGIALSPDGTKLAVSDVLNGLIYFLDPSNPKTIKSFMVESQFGFVINPCAVAVSDAGNVYYAVYVQGGTGADQFFKLNTKTGVITDYGVGGVDLDTDLYLRNAISSDNSRVFFNDVGYVFSVDTATDELSSAIIDPGCCYGDYELALSSNQTQFTATAYVYDYDLAAESYYALNDREILNILYVYGAKFSPDGRLLFQPSTNGIDVFDGNLGNLRSRISLPAPLSLNYDALVADGRDNVLVGITGTSGNGIAVVDLTSVSEPPQLPYENEFSARPHRVPELGNRLQTYSRYHQSGKQGGRSASAIRIVPHATRAVFTH